MDPPPAPSSSFSAPNSSQKSGIGRSQSFSSQTSDESHTAAEFINSQLALEAEAREALPYKFENCTKTIGKLRQVLFSCLTCNPPPANTTDVYNPAGVCYSCSIQCHGEHTLVELFNKRDFVCDCGTTRLPATSLCTIRLNAETNMKGGVHSEEPAPDNKYNHNFKNHFCGCECDYDAYKEKGTMFQCLGLGTVETGGCGEDWWHPGCVVGLGPDWYENTSDKGTSRKEKDEGLAVIAEAAEPIEPVIEASRQAAKSATQDGANSSNHTSNAIAEDEVEDEDPPLPPGFPEEDDFEGFICYKCVESNPWIKRYAGTPGFLAPVFRRSTAPSPEVGLPGKVPPELVPEVLSSKKRKAEDDEESDASGPSKRPKEDLSESVKLSSTGATDGSVEVSVPAKSETVVDGPLPCKAKTLPPAPTGQISIFFKSDFRDHLCRCSDCFPLLKPHEQLIEEEVNYEPSLSGDEDEAGGSTIGSGSLYDRGESALKNVDRVRAIEGVMAYNHLKEKLKPFFQQFAESGQAISAEDIKAHFAKMRGDEQAIKQAGEEARKSDPDHRKEQGGY